MYHTKKIGIFVSHIFGDFQRDLCQGLIDKASEFGYTAEIFASADGEDLGDYSLGEASILRIPDYNAFSGICFLSGTYLLSSLREKISVLLKEKCSCPVIEIRQTDTVFPHIILDNNSAAAQLTQHMITIHHHTRICYLGSSLEADFSEKRFGYYRSVMEKNHLPVHESDYCSCDSTAESLETALNHFLKTGRPDSVICYNDRLAVSLMELLHSKGFRIPEDIAVAGFDNLEIGQNLIPALTTVTFPIYEMGQKAMELLFEAINKKTLPFETLITAEPLYRASCGCHGEKIPVSPFYTNHLTKRIHSLESSMMQDIKMSAAMQGIHDLDKAMELLEKFLSRIDDCSEFYLCLYPNWNAISSHIQKLTQNPEEEDSNLLTLAFAYKAGKRLPECYFTSNSLLPDYLCTASDSAYIYTPLFFASREFGYAVFSYKDNQLSYPFHLLTWIANINTMLNNICEKRQTSLLINRLEDIYMKDELTGLYSARGFRMAGTEWIGQAKDSLLAMIIQLHEISLIRHTFGRLESSFAIQVLAHAIEHSCDETMLLSHPGGGEFYILARGCTTKDADRITAMINRYLENYNRLHTKPYLIHADSAYEWIENSQEISDIQDIYDNIERKDSCGGS